MYNGQLKNTKHSIELTNLHRTIFDGCSQAQHLIIRIVKMAAVFQSFARRYEIFPDTKNVARFDRRGGLRRHVGDVQHVVFQILTKTKTIEL